MPTFGLKCCCAGGCVVAGCPLPAADLVITVTSIFNPSPRTTTWQYRSAESSASVRIWRPAVGYGANWYPSGDSRVSLTATCGGGAMAFNLRGHISNDAPLCAACPVQQSTASAWSFACDPFFVDWTRGGSAIYPQCWNALNQPNRVVISLA